MERIQTLSRPHGRPQVRSGKQMLSCNPVLVFGGPPLSRIWDQHRIRSCLRNPVRPRPVKAYLSLWKPIMWCDATPTTANSHSATVDVDIAWPVILKMYIFPLKHASATGRIGNRTKWRLVYMWVNSQLDVYESRRGSVDVYFNFWTGASGVLTFNRVLADT